MFSFRGQVNPQNRPTNYKALIMQSIATDQQFSLASYHGTTQKLIYEIYKEIQNT